MKLFKTSFEPEAIVFVTNMEKPSYFLKVPYRHLSWKFDPPQLGGGISRLLADAENDKLRRLDRGDADVADQATVIDVVRGHRGPVNLTKKGPAP
jgi:hypothetical protein